MIYLDYAATAPTDPEVVAAMRPYFFEQFGNASSPHGLGRLANKALEDARQILARFLNAKGEEIVFTSGGTESNNQAIFGAARALKSKGNHIIVSPVEHHSVFEPVEALRREGFEVTWLDVDECGRVNPIDVRAAITERTILISVMHANNEIGTIQPVEAIGAIAHERGICFHVDAVQTVGHVPVDVQAIGVDVLSLSAHKFYGPKGVGALYVRRGIALERYLLGGDQERNRRASTHNVPGIVGLAKAIELCTQRMGEEAAQQRVWQKQLIDAVLGRIEGAILNGHPTQRLPNNVHFAFTALPGEALLLSLDMEGIAVSMGSACTSGALEPSHVLRAIGLSDDLALGALRISMGRWTTQDDIDTLLEKLPEAVERLRI